MLQPVSPPEKAGAKGTSYPAEFIIAEGIGYSLPKDLSEAEKTPIIQPPATAEGCIIGADNGNRTHLRNAKALDFTIVISRC